MTAKELREQRATLIKNAREILDEHGDENGNLPDDQQAKYERAMNEADAMLQSAKRIERLEIAEAGLSEGVGDRFDVDADAEGRKKTPTVAVRSRAFGADGKPNYRIVPAAACGTADYQAAFSDYLRHGTGMNPERRAALQSDDSDQAGFLVASEQFAAGMLRVVDDLLFIRRYAKIHTLRSAKSLGIRKRTTKMNTFAWSAELQVATADSALAIGKKVLTPHPLTGAIKASRDLLRNSVEPIDEMVRVEMATDAGELMEDGYMTGDGSQKPLGVFVASDDGISTSRDVNTSSATSIDADSLITAKYTLKSQYRRGGLAETLRWLFHRDAIKILAKLKDSDGQYLFRTGLGLRGEDPDRVLNIPMDESERAPNTFTAEQYVGLLANWQYYEIADALDLEIQVLVELYSETNQVGYIGRAKTDGMPTVEEAFVRLKTAAAG